MKARLDVLVGPDTQANPTSQDTHDQQAIDALNAAFTEHVIALSFKYRCEDCVHVVARANADFQCTLGYPNRWLTGPHRLVEPDGMYTFCKYFELGE